MFFRDKAHPSEVVKWGIFAALLEGAYIGIAATVLTQKPRLLALTGWELKATFLFLFFLSLGAVITTVIVFAHPIYSLLRKQYKDAFLTLVVTIITLLAVYGFIQFTYKQLF